MFLHASPTTIKYQLELKNLKIEEAKILVMLCINIIQHIFLILMCACVKQKYVSCVISKIIIVFLIMYCLATSTLILPEIVEDRLSEFGDTPAHSSRRKCSKFMTVINFIWIIDH